MRLATLDLETDPFLYGRKPEPFVAGFYDGEEFISIWGKDCVKRICDAITSSTKGPYLIYAHNGGKFDFYYFLQYLSPNLKIINGRIIQAHIGRHEIRDSYAIMPFPLRAYDKDDIDYSKMEANVRESHKEEIIRYLRKDCSSLLELVTVFREEFGDALTIGGSSMEQLKKHHKFKCGGAGFDEKFRRKFYFGGRVQVFKAGITHMPVRIYDVNSMYPYVMATALHPVGVTSEVSTKVRPNTCFLVVEGRNYGAFPVRKDDGELDFMVPAGRFYTTIHEYNAALETRTFVPTKIIKTYGFQERITFEEFVYRFYNARLRSKFLGDKIRELFFKYVLNSAYGKFAQNPENFQDNQLLPAGEYPEHMCVGPCRNMLPQRLRVGSLKEPCPYWHLAYWTEDYGIWRAPTKLKSYYNVTTGASITGAARAVLLRGLQDAIDPLYCDTDSIICRSLETSQVSAGELGAWKLEGSGTCAAISGKKMYAVIDENSLFPCVCQTKAKDGPCTVHIKKAHKGGLLSYAELFRIAKGETIEIFNPVPSFKLDGTHQWTKRRLQRTA